LQDHQEEIGESIVEQFTPVVNYVFIGQPLVEGSYFYQGQVDAKHYHAVSILDVEHHKQEGVALEHEPNRVETSEFVVLSVFQAFVE
jgi:hypothetical protein